jgi:phospholipid/cholesterol/gamma-HCH transport system substrate-binding protein
MTKPFKFRYVNEIAGSFVLLIAILVVTGIFVVARAQGWFKPEYTLRVKLPPEGSAGIQKGAEVSILGTPVGRVEEVIVNDDGSMETVLKIKMNFTRFIREDSKAILKKQFGVAGDAFMEIIRGSGKPLPNGATLPAMAQKDAEIVELLQELVGKLQDSALPILDQLQKAVAEYTGLAADMRKPDGHLQQSLDQLQKAVAEYAGLAADMRKPGGHLQQILARIEELVTGLQKGEGTAGKVLKDPATVNGVNEAIRSINASLAELQGIVADVKKTTENLPETAQQTRATLRQAEILIEGVQKHWLLRSYVEQQDAPALIPSTDVPTPEGK